MNGGCGGIGDTRAQSAAVGVVLLAGVVVIAAGVTGAFAVSSFSEQAIADPPMLGCAIDYQTETAVTHAGGESVEAADLSVLLENASGVTRVPFAVDSGDGDGTFETGEVATFGSVDQDTEVRVLSPNSVVCEGAVSPSEPPAATILEVTDHSQCSTPTADGTCKGDARANVATFDVAWRAADDRGLSAVRVELVDGSGTVVDSESRRVNGGTVTGSLTLRGEGGDGREYTIRLTVTDAENQPTTDDATVTAGGDSP